MLVGVVLGTAIMAMSESVTRMLSSSWPERGSASGYTLSVVSRSSCERPGWMVFAAGKTCSRSVVVQNSFRDALQETGRKPHSHRCAPQAHLRRRQGAWRSRPREPRWKSPRGSSPCTGMCNLLLHRAPYICFEHECGQFYT